MKKFIFILPLVCLLLILSGCSKKIYIKVPMTVPAVIPEAMNYKRLVVLPIKDDSFGMTSFLEQKLIEKTSNGEKIYELINRENIAYIIDEQDFTHTKYVDKIDTIDFGQIKGVDAILLGSLNDTAIYDTYFHKWRTICVGEGCKETKKIRINCTKRDYATNMTLKMLDVKTGKIIFSKNNFRKKTTRVCDDDYYRFYHSDDVIRKMHESIIDAFVSLMIPTKYEQRVHIAYEEPYIALSSTQEDRFYEAVNALKYKNTTKAKTIFNQILKETNNQSYTAMHNLGIAYEIEGDYIEAKEIYNKCSFLVKDLSKVPELNTSIIRVNKIIKNKNLEKGKI